MAQASGVEKQRVNPVTRTVTGMVRNGAAERRPRLSMAAITTGVKPIDGNAIRMRDGMTCARPRLFGKLQS
jgi:hypothetical protein